jgi:hypothetical protein
MRRILPAVLPASLALALLAPQGAARAAEGMWVPQQLPEIAGPLAEAGLALPPEQLADLTGQPMGAVVALGGCTASFVSPEGLVATNHHCAYGAIQLNSTAERNLMTDGFIAATRADELSAGPGARVFVIDAITDVTERMHAARDSTRDPLRRQQAMEDAQKALVAECEAEPGTRCTVYSFFEGQTFRLFKQLEIRDVRLAYAPPDSIGAYGGDIDNWMWPRHTGDFTFYRAYVGPDGRPAAYSEDNVPYRPRHFLPMASEPLQAGDFVMVAGYPGRTNRYALAAEFEATRDWTYPVVGQHYRDLIALVNAAGEADAEVGVKYASIVRGWNNAEKNFTGQLEGFARIDAGAAKRADEEAVLAWLRAQGRQGRAALAAHRELMRLFEEGQATRDRDLYVGQVASQGLLGQVRGLYRLAQERQKPNEQRAAGYQERDLPGFQAGIAQLERRFDPGMERQLMAYWLQRYVTLPAAQRIPAVDAWLGGDDAAAIERALEATYAGTALVPVEARTALLEASPEDFENSEDPIIRLALALQPAMREMEAAQRRRAGEQAVHRPVFLAAVQDYRRSQGGAVYPDANLSLRITFGNVMGYQPRDGMAATPFTTLEGIAAKDTGEVPFNSPQRQLELIAARDHGPYADAALGTVPVNYLANLDITGGNSGSPTLNRKGEFIGLVFDGNWESVSSNWVFDPAMTRSIHVDSRYMLWVMDKVFPAHHLLRELGVEPSSEGPAAAPAAGE